MMRYSATELWTAGPRKMIKSISQMMQRFFSVCFAMSVACCSTAYADIDARNLFRNANPSVVVLFTFTESGEPVGLGTGFFVGDGTKIATNAHVIADSRQVIARLVDGSVQTLSSVYASNPERDLVLLTSPVRGNPLKLAARQVEIGEEVLTIGNPRGFERTISAGIVSGIRGDAFIQITAPISPGNSGGPVLDSAGQVLGVATLTRTDAQNLNFAVPASYVSELLRAPGIPIAPKQAMLPKADSIAVSRSPPAAAPVAATSSSVELSVSRIRGDCCGRSGLDLVIKNPTSCIVSGVHFRARFKVGPNKSDPFVEEANVFVPAIVPAGASQNLFTPLGIVSGHGNAAGDPLDSRWFVVTDALRIEGCASDNPSTSE